VPDGLYILGAFKNSVGSSGSSVLTAVCLSVCFQRNPREAPRKSRSVRSQSIGYDWFWPTGPIMWKHDVIHNSESRYIALLSEYHRATATDKMCRQFGHVIFEICERTDKTYRLQVDHSTSSTYRLVAWHSGRTSVFGRRTFPVLRLTGSWRVLALMWTNRPL